MKVRLVSSIKGMKSGSLKRLAQALSTALGYKVWRSTKPRVNRIHLKYGDSVDKLTQYKWFQQQGLSALEFTTDGLVADTWVHEDGCVVFGRKLLNASCGDGIVIFKPGDIDGCHGCPVYTKYKPKKREFLVHVFKDKVVAIVEKRRKKDSTGDTKIRNLANGYVFCEEVDITEDFKARIEALALASAKVCSSDFKGVDLGYNQKMDDLFVIEVNSAPGIEGSNVGKYVEVIKNHVQN